MCFAHCRSRITPEIGSQLMSLRDKLRRRTASFKKEALSPPSPEDSENEEDDKSHSAVDLCVYK